MKKVLNYGTNKIIDNLNIDDEIIKNVDLLTPNETELEIITKQIPKKCICLLAFF